MGLAGALDIWQCCCFKWADFMLKVVNSKAGIAGGCQHSELHKTITHVCCDVEDGLYLHVIG